jgi:hypothetical protein
MAASGWYPDPGGEPGRFRYWDGHRWSSETTDRPASTPPPLSRPRRSSRWAAPALLIIALLLIVSLIAAILVRTVADDAATDAPAATGSGWDDSQPLPTAPPSSAGPSRAPRPTAAPPAEPSPGYRQPDDAPPPTTRPRKPVRRDCDRGDSEQRRGHPSDGRVHGGDLAFSPPPGVDWIRGGHLSWGWAYDLDGVFEQIDSGHNVLHWVGAVRPAAEKQSLKHEAEVIMSCLVHDSGSGQGLPPTGVRSLTSAKVSVDGADGWLIRTAVAFDDLQHGADGILLHLVVIEVDGRRSFFVGQVPYPDPARIARMEQIAAGLELS